MQIEDQAAWNRYREKNKDPYGKAIIDYAERWANLMEKYMAEGHKLEEIADPTSHEADLGGRYGITGFQYGAAVHTLASTWRWGEQLRHWHNLKYGAPDDAKGTVNPALVTIK